MSHPRHLIFIIDGCVGCGKTTFFEHLKMHPALNKRNVVFVEEPVEAFQTWNTHKPLELFQKNPFSESLSTQIHIMNVLYQRYHSLIASCEDNTVFVCDRYITSCEIFTKVLYQNGYISEFGRDITLGLLNEKCEMLIHPHGVFYLKRDIDLCFKRIAKRERAGEVDFFTTKYISNLVAEYDAASCRCNWHTTKTLDLYAMAAEFISFLRQRIALYDLHISL